MDSDNIEFRSVGHPLCLGEVRTDSGVSATISGYGAVYFREGDDGTQYRLFEDLIERIMPGAFDEVLDDDVRGLFNHEPDHVLGRSTAGTLRLDTNRRGLRYEIDPPDTTIGRDVVHLLKRGDVTGSSFSFTVREQTWRESEDVLYREITQIGRLFDVGPVTFPAYTSTTAKAAPLSRAAQQRLAEFRSKRSGMPREYYERSLAAFEFESGLTMAEWSG